MDVAQALRRRRMIRSFDGSPLNRDVVISIFEESLWSPTAGNSRGISWVVLVGNQDVARYFDAATDASWQAASPRFEGLARASAIGICVMDPTAYLERYAADDKERSGLGREVSAWPVPYWVGDAGAATLAALLLAEARGLDGCFLGAFRRHQELRAEFQLPAHVQLYGAVLIGRSDGANRRSASLDRPGPSRRQRVHRGTYSDGAP